jgi:hypothetical protein
MFQGASELKSRAQRAVISSIVAIPGKGCAIRAQGMVIDKSLCGFYTE